VDNLPRVLPAGTQANIRRSAWQVPPIFRIIESGGRIDADEMYQVFNMGIGMTLIVPKKRAAEAIKLTKGKAIGEIVEGSGKVVLV
jgi:phosphoribosylformylglycinamidine cyclo-ligase